MKLLKWLDKYFEDYVLVFLMVMVVSITTLQVVMRYVFNDSLVWSEELSRYIFIWIIYIGVSKAVATDSHLTVDAIDSILNEKQQVIVSIISDVLFVIFALIMVVFTTGIVISSTRLSGALQIPLSYVYAASATGFSLSLVRLIQRIYKRVKQFESFDHLSQKGVEKA